MDPGVIDGRRKRFFFETKRKAETKASQLRVMRANEGAEGLHLPEALRLEARACSERLAVVGATLTEATNYFLQHARPAGGHKTVLETIEEFLAAKKQAGRKESYLSVQRYTLANVFGKSFGARVIGEVKSAELRAWLDRQPWTPRTRKNYHTDLSNLFGFALRWGYCGSNPFDRLDVPHITRKAPGILTVGQCETLLKVAAELEGGNMLPAIAIGLFCGIRAAEIQQLNWSDVKLSDRVIMVSAMASKTRERRIVDVPLVLEAWLRPVVDPGKPVAPQKSFDWNLRKCWEAAKIVPWPHNACRHTFASMHLAHHRNAALTASQLGHFGSTRSLISNYREVVSPAEAARFWELRPNCVP